MNMTSTKFILYKGELEVETRFLGIVRLLLKQGWKIKQSKFSELI